MTHETPNDLPNDLASCHQMIESLTAEMEQLRRLLHQFVHGSRSEKRILDSPGQGLLPFETQE